MDAKRTNGGRRPQNELTGDVHKEVRRRGFPFPSGQLSNLHSSPEYATVDGMYSSLVADRKVGQRKDGFSQDSAVHRRRATTIRGMCFQLGFRRPEARYIVTSHLASPEQPTTSKHHENKLARQQEQKHRLARREDRSSHSPPVIKKRRTPSPSCGTRYAVEATREPNIPRSRRRFPCTPTSQR